MLNVVLSHGALGWQLMLQFGSSDGVLAFGGRSACFLAFGCVAVGILAAVFPQGGGCCGDQRGYVRRRGPRLWVVALVVCLVVLAGRGFKQHIHTPVSAEVRAVPARRGADPTISELEQELDRVGNQLDRVGAQVDRAFDHSANQLDGQIDHGAAQIERQVDRGTIQVVRQLEHTIAQIRRQIEHVGLQLQRQRREAARHEAAHTITIATATEEPDVIEPSPPALPISGFITIDVTDPPAPVTPPAITPPATPPTPHAAPQAPVPAPTPVVKPEVASTPNASPEAKAASNADPNAEPEPMPEWAKKEIVDEGSRKLVVVKGAFGDSPKDAEHEALEAARRVLGDSVQRAYPKVGHWLPSEEAVRKEVLLTHVETIHRKTVSSGIPFHVYRAYLQVEASPAVSARLVSGWRDAVLPKRLEALGGIVALLTLTFATGAAYFRLDDRTHGRYRGRLRLGAVTLIAAGAAAAAALI